MGSTAPQIGSSQSNNAAVRKPQPPVGTAAEGAEAVVETASLGGYRHSPGRLGISDQANHLATLPETMRQGALLRLQRQHGNGYVQRVVAEIRDQSHPASPSVVARSVVQREPGEEGTIDAQTLANIQSEIRRSSALRGLINQETPPDILRPGYRPHFHILSDSQFDANVHTIDPNATPSDVVGYNRTDRAGGGEVEIRHRLLSMPHLMHVTLIHETLHSLMNNANGSTGDLFNEAATQFLALMVIYGGTNPSLIQSGQLYREPTTVLLDVVRQIPGLQQHHIAEYYIQGPAGLRALLERVLGAGGYDFVRDYVRTGNIPMTSRARTQGGADSFSLADIIDSLVNDRDSWVLTGGQFDLGPHHPALSSTP